MALTLSGSAGDELLKVQLVDVYCQLKPATGSSASGAFPFTGQPVLETAEGTVFGANAICRYLALSAPSKPLGEGSLSDDRWIEWEEATLAPLVQDLVVSGVDFPVECEDDAPAAAVALLDEFSLLYGNLQPPPPPGKRVKTVPHEVHTNLRLLKRALATLDCAVRDGCFAKPCLASVVVCVTTRRALSLLAADSGFAALRAHLDIFFAEPAVAAVAAVAGGAAVGADVEHEAGASLVGTVQRLFSAAIAAAFPALELKLQSAAVERGRNAAFGDFQCNSPMSIYKALKTAGGAAPTSPKAVGDAIVAALSVPSAFLASAEVAPAGFINVKLAEKFLSEQVCALLAGDVLPPTCEPKQVVIDFSSPNIAKEMHVGHLRSTIIGDAVARILEFCGHTTKRVNHVGDWGTQFGMLIRYMEVTYPNFLSDPPNITDLTVFYKNAKAKFDEDEEFKDIARKTVVKLQAGDKHCIAVWKLLCEISRVEFQKVYDRLHIVVEEFGESYYNKMIPPVIEMLEKKSLIDKERGEGASCIFLPKHSFPLMVKKSDGGFGYDSTDMAAIHHRLQTLKADWLIYVTDLGQAEHFHMCFEAAALAEWTRPNTRLVHVGFGVVQGNDGKRFKTRSGETVRLVDLLDEAVERMKESLSERVEEGKCPLKKEEVAAAAAKIGYGAVKYFDLHQVPTTNYKFSYDKMLSTSGNTAVYLMFAYARLASIVRKAKDEFKADVAELVGEAEAELKISHVAERSLVFELMQFQDVILSVLADFMPCHVCGYLYKLATCFTDFVTQCKVLGVPEQNSRLLLCEATGKVMRQCFDLIGIEYLERI